MEAVLSYAKSYMLALNFIRREKLFTLANHLTLSHLHAIFTLHAKSIC